MTAPPLVSHFLWTPKHPVRQPSLSAHAPHFRPTDQAPGGNSDVYLRPAAYYPDPFRKGDNVLVLCECYNNDGTPNKSNYRYAANKALTQCASEHPWFGIEQEYSLFDVDEKPYGWPKGGFPGPQGPYYCGVGE